MNNSSQDESGEGDLIMDFNIDELIETVQSDFQDMDNRDIQQAPAPSSIRFNQKAVLKKGYMMTLNELLIGLPDTDSLYVKMPGNCMFYPYNGNKTLMIGDQPNHLNFRIGEHGHIHDVVIPAAE